MASFSGANEAQVRNLINQHQGGAKQNPALPSPAKKVMSNSDKNGFKPLTLDQLQTAIQSAVNTCAKEKAPAASPGQVHVVRSEVDLRKLQATGKLVVTDWFAKWCGPCMNFKPTFQKMAEEYKDVLFCQIDVDESREFAAKYSVSKMPTFKASCHSQHTFVFCNHFSCFKAAAAQKFVLVT